MLDLSTVFGSDDTEDLTEALVMDGLVVVELAQGTTVKINSQDWYCNESYVILDWVSNNYLKSNTGAQMTNPPVKLYLPVETKSSATDERSETEISAHVPAEVRRHAKVGRSPENSEVYAISDSETISVDNINLPYLKIHVDSQW